MYNKNEVMTVSAHKFIDETGHVYGQLTVIKRLPNKGQKSMWLCRCTCGNDVVARGQDLRDGNTSRCKACTYAAVGDAQRGLCGEHPREYSTWQHMRKRCYATYDPGYKSHGGRGIKVCDRWLGEQGFANFYHDMGDNPPGMSLDRIDNDGDYSPENCRWANDHVQAVNRRSTVFIEVDGVCAHAREWEQQAGLNRGTVRDRLRRGWSPVDAVLLPAYSNVPPTRHGTENPPENVVVGDCVDVHIGQVFGQLTVVGPLKPLTCGHPRVLCQCSCGRYMTVHERTLLKGLAVGCGCSPVTQDALRVARRQQKVMNGEDKLLKKARTAYTNLRATCTNAANPRYVPGRTFGWANFDEFLATVGLPADEYDRLAAIDATAYTAATVHWQRGGQQVQRTTRAWNFMDLTGKRFGRWTVLGEADERINDHVHWRCRCDCGTEAVVDGQDLRNGRSKSCGCFIKDWRGPVKSKEVVAGLTRKDWRRRYDSMHARCENPANNRYYCYGARGVYVDARWSGEDGFEHFIDDVARHWPGPGWTLDRADNNGPYSPANTRWATVSQQANNKSVTRYITVNGETHSAAEWERIMGFSRGLITYRIDHCGWSPADAVNTPVRMKKQQALHITKSKKGMMTCG